MRKLRNKTTALGLIASALFLSSASQAVAQVRDDSIPDHVSALHFLVGDWRLVATFHSRTGQIEIDEGTYKATPVLGGSYLKIDMTLAERGRPESAHSLIELVTYNPKTKKYDGTYFYSRSALRVSEQGEFDPVSGIFKTVAFIPREDGVRDENVRTLTQAIGTKQVRYAHYSRYNDEAKETMDLEILMTRDEQPAHPG